MNFPKFRDMTSEKPLLILSFSLGLLYLVRNNFILEEIIVFVRNNYFRLINDIQYLDDATPASERFLPFLVTILFLAVVFLIKSPSSRYVRLAVVVYTFCLHTVYIVFRVGTLNCRDPISISASILLFSTECVHYLMMCCFYLQMAWPIERSRQADSREKVVISGSYTPTVGIFIPTYNEPVKVLRRTLIGCQAINYPFKNVYLLDDTARPEMKKLAMEIGCNYIARKDNIDAKAGNLNNALFQTSEELIAFFDCDNIPSSNFLSRMVGFFYDPMVAMVISSLHYFNAQEQTKNIGIEMMIATDHANSLINSQTGRDAFNALLCFGTSYIIRRKPLEEIGGIPTETLCEDWATSIKLQAMGYKTCFLNEVLSSGMAAENLTEFVQQRLRWCQGTLQSLFAPTNPMRIKGFSLGQRVIHISGVFYYVMYPVTFISLVIPLLYFFFGIVPIEANVVQFTYYFLPYFVMYNMMYIWFSRRFSSLVASMISDFILCFPLTVVAVKTVVKPFGKRFRVTKKGFTSDNISFIPSIGLPMLIMFLAYLIGVGLGSGNVYWMGVGEPFFVYSLWCVYRMIFFWMSFHAAVNLPQRRKDIRIIDTLKCQLFSMDNQYLGEGKVRDISDAGLQLKVEMDSIPETVKVFIPQLYLKNAHARIVRRVLDRNAFVFGLEFLDLTLENQRRIIEFIYCKPGRWGHRIVPESILVRSLLKFVSKIRE